MPRHQKLIFATILLAGVGLLVAAGMIGNSDKDDISVSSNPAIDELIPERGDEVLQQQRVGIDLAPEYRLVRLTISPDARCRFPVDVTAHTRHVEGLQQYIYTPGAGLPVEGLAADFNCVEATFEKTSRPGETETIDWAFSVS